jgi:hypothetical protein
VIAATVTQPTKEELLYVVFSARSVPRLYNKRQLGVSSETSSLQSGLASDGEWRPEAAGDQWPGIAAMRSYETVGSL